jgi:hypothetical protein
VADSDGAWMRGQETSSIDCHTGDACHKKDADRSLPFADGGSMAARLVRPEDSPLLMLLGQLSTSASHQKALRWLEIERS